MMLERDEEMKKCELPLLELVQFVWQLEQIFLSVLFHIYFNG